MSKREEFIQLLKGMKETNITYKQIAAKLNIKVNTLYTWIQKGNIGEKRAAYLIKQIERTFPDEYVYVMIANALHEIENELREEMQAGNGDFAPSLSTKLLNIPPIHKEKDNG